MKKKNVLKFNMQNKVKVLWKFQKFPSKIICQRKVIFKKQGSVYLMEDDGKIFLN